MNKLRSFTLAEILITLGIIGIVAAMTLPTLLTKVQSVILKSQLKKEYSVIQNALNITSNEGIINCYIYYPQDGTAYRNVTTQCNNLKTRFAEILNAKKVTNVYKDLYKKKDDVIAEGGASVNRSVAYDDILKNAEAFQLADGSVYLICRTYIILDVNGINGPNKFGYDVFFMHYYLDDKIGRIIMVNYLAGLKEKGGYYPEEIIKSIEVKYSDSYRQNFE